MSLHVATMNPVNISSRKRKPMHLGRKLVLLVLLINAYALALVLLYQKEFWFSLILINIFADSTLAVVAGFGTRLLFPKRNWFIRIIVASVMPVVGLATIGYFSDWKIGIDVFALYRGYISYEDLSHLIFCITVSLAALRAWYQPVPRETDSAYAESVQREVNAPPRRISQPRSWSLQPRLRNRSSVAIWSGNSSRSSVHARPRLVTNQPARQERNRNSSAQRQNIQLALVEEHRCPYCLEPVVHTDPRGVKKCNVCQSLHHADCWAVTGTCQVPHLNTRN